jgi:hypothetical protein
VAPTLVGVESPGFVHVGITINPVYAPPAAHEGALNHRTVDVCQTISNFARMRRSTVRHVQWCTECHGGHFEHLLQMHVFSSQIKCFRTLFQ